MVSSATVLRDTIFTIKSFLSGNLPDSISNRPANQSFIMTSYPTRETTYPLITIKDTNSFDQTWLGLQSEAMAHYIEMEIRVWANNVKNRDDLAGSIYNIMRQNRFGAAGFTGSELHDMRLLSSVNVDDPSGPKSKVMSYRFLTLPGDI